MMSADALVEWAEFGPAGGSTVEWSARTLDKVVLYLCFCNKGRSHVSECVHVCVCVWVCVCVCVWV